MYSFYSIGQGKSSLVLCGPPVSVEMEVNYHIFMVDHRSTCLPECGPVEYLAPEPCHYYN